MTEVKRLRAALERISAYGGHKRPEQNDDFPVDYGRDLGRYDMARIARLALNGGADK